MYNCMRILLPLDSIRSLEYICTVQNSLEYICTVQNILEKFPYFKILNEFRIYIHQFPCMVMQSQNMTFQNSISICWTYQLTMPFGMSRLENFSPFFEFSCCSANSQTCTFRIFPEYIDELVNADKSGGKDFGPGTISKLVSFFNHHTKFKLFNVNVTLNIDFASIIYTKLKSKRIFLTHYLFILFNHTYIFDLNQTLTRRHFIHIMYCFNY